MCQRNRRLLREKFDISDAFVRNGETLNRSTLWNDPSVSPDKDAESELWPKQDAILTHAFDKATLTDHLAPYINLADFNIRAVYTLYYFEIQFKKGMDINIHIIIKIKIKHPAPSWSEDLPLSSFDQRTQHKMPIVTRTAMPGHPQK